MPRFTVFRTDEWGKKSLFSTFEADGIQHVAEDLSRVSGGLILWNREHSFKAIEESGIMTGEASGDVIYEILEENRYKHFHEGNWYDVHRHMGYSYAKIDGYRGLSEINFTMKLLSGEWPEDDNNLSIDFSFYIGHRVQRDGDYIYITLYTD